MSQKIREVLKAIFFHGKPEREVTDFSVDELLEKRAHGCVTDGASAGTAAATRLGLNWIHCLAHAFQLCIKDFCKIDCVNRQLGLCMSVASFVKRSNKARCVVGNLEIGSKTRFDNFLNVMHQVLSKKDLLFRFAGMYSGSSSRIAKLRENINLIDWSLLEIIVRVSKHLIGLTQ